MRPVASAALFNFKQPKGETMHNNHTLAELMRLLSEALAMVEDDDPPAPSGDWATEARNLLNQQNNT